MQKSKILFSIPVHEKLEVVLDQLINIRTLNPDSCVVLHLSPVFDYVHSALPLDEFKRITKTIGGVIINPVSVRTGFFDIIQAHIANFNYALTVLDFEYIALLASNEMFVKPGLYDYIKNYDAGVDYCVIPTTTKARIGKCAFEDPELRGMLDELKTDEICRSQIEGSFYRKDVFKEMCEIINRHFDYRHLTKEDLYAREEVYFSAVFWGLYKDNNTISVSVKGMFTFVPWNRFSLFVNLSEAKKLSENDSNLFCIKRVDRTINDPIRIFLRQKYQYDTALSQYTPIKKAPLWALHLMDYYGRCKQNATIFTQKAKKRILSKFQ